MKCSGKDTGKKKPVIANAKDAKRYSYEVKKPKGKNK